MALANLGLGVIEGFYGPPWSWQARQHYARFLHAVGFSFYLYAPKRCEQLRRQWTSAWPSEEFSELMTLRAIYADAGIRFGIGLSPYSGGRELTNQSRQDLQQRVRFLNQLEPDFLGLFFDDMPSSDGDFVGRQIEMTELMAEETIASTLLICPTYYSDDPVLAKFSGEPGDYLEQLGARLPDDIHVFWTGPQVCSTEITGAHLLAVERRLGRRVLLWDNYPVNDGVKMSRYLHLSGFQGRNEVPRAPCTGHAVNPMNQAFLSKLPITTLADVYMQGDNYNAEHALERALRRWCTPEFANQLRLDQGVFEKAGLDSLSHTQVSVLHRKYQDIGGPYATEVCGWLRGEYQPLPADLAEFAEYQT